MTGSTIAERKPVNVLSRYRYQDGLAYYEQTLKELNAV